MNEQQLSLEDVETLSNISEIERTTTTVKEKITFVAPMKKCRRCKQLKPTTEFYKREEYRGGRRSWCKYCEHDAYIMRRKNPDVVKSEREHSFLYATNIKKRSGFLHGSGFCAICGEQHPLVLENHHIVPWDAKCILSLCANCHRKLFTPNRETHMIAVLNAIENSKFLWSDIDEEDIRVEFNPEIGEESPLVEVLVG